MQLPRRLLPAALALALFLPAQSPRPRLRDLGVVTGILPTGSLNAITDVAGVAVGQVTIHDPARDLNTGVTAILPHSGNLFQQKVPGAVVVGNAFGKLMGSTQVAELGEIETPILLTSTLDVPRAADALLSYMLALPGNEKVQSVNPLVGETNDGYLSDIRARAVGQAQVLAALRSARGGPVEEGAVGAGSGTVAFGFKGGIGTASRRLPAALGGFTIGVLVQTNFGGILDIDGAPVGRALHQYYLRNQLGRPAQRRLGSEGTPAGASISGTRGEAALGPAPDGSCMIVVATDAPLEARNLRRLAARALLGLARTGSAASNGSGDYVIAFSTAADLRIPAAPQPRTLLLPPVSRLRNDAMSPLFLAAIEATQEAIYNSLFKATTTSGRGHTVPALPLPATEALLRQYQLMKE